LELQQAEALVRILWKPSLGLGGKPGFSAIPVGGGRGRRRPRGFSNRSLSRQSPCAAALLCAPRCRRRKWWTSARCPLCNWRALKPSHGESVIAHSETSLEPVRRRCWFSCPTGLSLSRSVPFTIGQGRHFQFSWTPWDSERFQGSPDIAFTEF
jgi:hypothetical protein